MSAIVTAAAVAPVLSADLSKALQQLEQAHGESYVLAEVLQDAAAVLRTVDDHEGFSLVRIDEIIESCDRWSHKLRMDARRRHMQAIEGRAS